MPLDEQIIGVVDDDESVRMAVGSLLRSLGFKIELFGSAEDLLGSAQLDDIACLIVDVRLPGLSGLDLQRQLLAGKREFPMIFIRGVLIGGASDLQKLMQSGELARRLEDAPERK